MNTDLHDRFTDIAGPAPAPSAATLTADLERGHSALRRHRLAQVGGAGLLAAVLAAVLVVPGVRTGGVSTNIAGPPAATGTAADEMTSRSPARLVAYTGAQPHGFTVDEVPEGWEVQGSDESAFMLAPKGIADQDPASFVGKIGITLEKRVPDVTTKKVTVNDKPALLATMAGNDRPGTVFIAQPSGAYLVIQVWKTLNWGEQELVRFAGGVHVGKDARPMVG
ncbi:hypothetical protein [Micromonospora sp. RTGN7]|uniref:hypothetical protein n=1 Tax=Micromonospora sp. RTGN7 TaxID=3016526 RepID=UPI0029FEF59E|nr:hypothetical protein [Micromonospora sp. RTGN7]